jgi:hypothetical protein
LLQKGLGEGMLGKFGGAVLGDRLFQKDLKVIPHNLVIRVIFA